MMQFDQQGYKWAQIMLMFQNQYTQISEISGQVSSISGVQDGVSRSTDFYAIQIVNKAISIVEIKIPNNQRIQMRNSYNV